MGASLFNLRLWAGLAAAVLVAGAALGCQSYKDGATRTTGELLDDSAIQMKVKTLLIRDKLVNGLRLNVEVKRGVVGLHGWVATEAGRQRATEVAGAVKGVKSVDNQLGIKDR